MRAHWRFRASTRAGLRNAGPMPFHRLSCTASPAMAALAVSVAVACASCGSSSSSTDTPDAGASTGGPSKVTDAAGLPEPGTFGDGAAPDSQGGTPSDGTLAVIIRDFKLYKSGDATTNPDFENVPQDNAPLWDDKDIVGPVLGADSTPVYKNPGGTTLTTHGQPSFDQWYHDTPGVNLRVKYPIKLEKNAAGAYEYDSEKVGIPLDGAGSQKMFFPIDDGSAFATAFGQQGDPHNYCFTAEIHTVFTYNGGEYFSFRGDDDVFVYVDKKLLINLGGIHGPESGRIELDSLGLTKGQSYPLDFFFAERHKSGSNVLFTTTLKLEPAVIK
jgi:fibro-slime domain-containing protein